MSNRFFSGDEFLDFNYIMNMERKRFLFLLLFFLPLINPVWADDMEISLLTMAPGKELYSAFGHSALRVNNFTTGEDLVYNYGLFDYSEPWFYLNFVRGRMNYRLASGPYKDFFISYYLENREIREQVFDMTREEKEFVAAFLENNEKPENSYYRYHYFYDNCATRIRDLLLLTYQGIELPAAEKNPSYRDLLHQYLHQRSWEKLGIDIILGISADRKTNAYMQTFLPDYLFTIVSKMEYNGRSIIKDTRTVFVPENPVMPGSGFIPPLVVFSCICLLAVVLTVLRKKARAFDFMLFFITGILGVLMVLLWFFTEHMDMRNNFNIIWAFPVHGVMAFFVFSKTHGRIYRTYFLITGIVTTLFLITWPLIPQGLNPVLIPFLAGISIRSFVNYFDRLLNMT